MTPLQQYIHDEKLDEVEAMNELQNVAGIISDCCVWAEDVAEVNQDDAIGYLKEWRKGFL